MTYTEEEYNDMLREKAAELQALHLDHAAQIEALNQAHAEALATAQGQAPSPSTDLLAEMDAEFSLLPEAVQAAFAAAWATVRVLVQAGKQSLAHSYVDYLAVPSDLAATKAAILAKLAP